MSAAQDGAAVPPAARAGLLVRQNTLRERLESGVEELQRRLEPMLEAANTAVDEVANLLDTPGALEEALSGQKPSEAPMSATTAAVEAAAEAKQEAKLERLGGSLIDPHKIMLQDKLAFVFGVGNVCLTAFWVGRSPETYHYFWLFKDICLFTLRFLVYKSRGMHYMMLEYCYAANLLGFVYIFLMPQSAFLRRFSFAVMAGPLMWSIVAMRNSLVFHSGDMITTLMMHASPAISAWCMRWHPRPEWTAGMSAEQRAEWDSASWLEMAVVPTALNFAWVLVYYFIIFVLLNRRIQQRGYQNMFTAMVTRPSARKSAFSKLVLAAPKAVQPLLYLGMHTFASWLALLPTKLWFDHYWLHTAILIAILTVSAWNGANFYFRVFAKKMMQHQVERQQASQESKKAA